MLCQGVKGEKGGVGQRGPRGEPGPPSLYPSGGNEASALIGPPGVPGPPGPQVSIMTTLLCGRPNKPHNVPCLSACRYVSLFCAGS